MKMPVKIDRDRLRQILAEREEINREALALEFGCHPDSMKRVLREEFGITTEIRHYNLTNEELGYIARQAHDGPPSNWIAEDLHVPPSVVRERRAPEDRFSLDEWRPVWQAIRRNPVLLALHREFAPKAATDMQVIMSVSVGTERIAA